MEAAAVKAIQQHMLDTCGIRPRLITFSPDAYQELVVANYDEGVPQSPTFYGVPAQVVDDQLTPFLLHAARRGYAQP